MKTLVRPSFTVSPERRLILMSDAAIMAVDHEEGEFIDARRMRAMNELVRIFGARISENDEFVATSFDLNRVFDADASRSTDTRIYNFLKAIEVICDPMRDKDGTIVGADPVAVPSILSKSGFNLDVFPHFQEWLEATQITSDMEWRYTDAMSFAYGAQAVRQNAKIHEDLISELSLEFFPKAVELLRAAATVEWTEIGEERATFTDLRHFRLCYGAGRLGLSISDRPRRMNISSLSSYDMQNDSVANIRDIFSLFLGAGAMAYDAAHFEGSVDLTQPITAS